LIAYLGLHITRRHRALPDAQALWQFWCDLRARPNREEIEAALEKITRVRQPKTKLRRVPDPRPYARRDGMADVGAPEPLAGSHLAAEPSVVAETHVELDVDATSDLDAA
jgi:hypothetical protein